MRFVRSLVGVIVFASVAASVACGSADPDPTGTDVSQLASGGLGATGDNCSIDLPGGTKKPGKENDKGQCCSVWDDKDCHDIPKAPPPSAPGKLVGNKNGGGFRR